MLHCDKDARSIAAIQGESASGNRTMGQIPPIAPACASVIVPAHNEAQHIGRTIRDILRAAHLAASKRGQGVTIIVVCNACADDTAGQAAAAAPTATIIETETRGKARAINLALAVAPPGPVIVVDADVAFEPCMLDAMLTAVAADGVLAASPVARFALADASLPVRAYYRAFSRHPYLCRGVGGSGVYALSATGRERIGTLPPIAADDEYVRNLFPLEFQRRVACDAEGRPVRVSVHPPRTLVGLLKTEIRSRNGDRAVRRLCPPRSDVAPSWIWAAFRAAPFDLAIFAAVKFAARLLMPFSRSGRGDGWAASR